MRSSGSPKQRSAPRKTPQRTCVVCREVAPKRTLMRVVRTPEGRVIVDPKGKVSGRGAYLCGRQECFTGKRAKEAVCRALQVSLEDAEWVALVGELKQLALDRSLAVAGKDD